EIISAVIVGDLVAGLDVPDGADEDLLLARPHVAFRVWPAGVIGVARDVAACRPVDGPAPVQLEQGLVLDRVLFLYPTVEQWPLVLDDPRALPDFLGGEETEPGA